MDTRTAEPNPPAPYEREMRQPAPTASKALGRVAMLLGIGVFVVSVAVSVAMGFAAAPYAIIGPSGFHVNLDLASGDPTEATLAVLAFLHIGLGTAIGLWAITQGIIAIATGRGRAYGVVGLVAAFLAPGVSLVIYLATAIAAAS